MKRFALLVAVILVPSTASAQTNAGDPLATKASALLTLMNDISIAPPPLYPNDRALAIFYAGHAQTQIGNASVAEAAGVLYDPFFVSYSRIFNGATQTKDTRDPIHNTITYARWKLNTSNGGNAPLSGMYIQQQVVPYP